MGEKQKSLLRSVADKLLLLGLAVVIVAPVAVFFAVSGEEPTVCRSRDDLDELAGDTELIVTSGLSDDDMPSLARFEHVNELELHYSEITEIGAAEVANLTGLERLVVHGINLKNDGVSKFRTLVNLQTLVLVGCVDVTDAGTAFLADLSALETLDFHRMAELRDGACLHIAKCPRLRHLSLDFCFQIGNGGVAHLASIKTLETLSLHGLDGLTDAALKDLAKLKSLLNLELPLHANFSDQALARLHKLLPDCKINR